MKNTRTRLILLLIALCLNARIFGASSENVVVVLSSDSPPYQQALAGFRETFGSSAGTFILSKEEPRIPRAVRVIVAIGGKAALYAYDAPQAVFIYCLAPGVYVDANQHPVGLTKVYVSPPPNVLIRQLRDLQPALKRLHAFWINDSATSYGKALKEEGEKAGMTIIPERLNSLDELPDRLRAIRGRVDALWLPPDPLLITPQSFAMIRQFSFNNDIPLYVSMDTLVDQGAAASISVSFQEMGRKTGVLAAQAISGSSGKLGFAYYGDKISLTINTTSASNSGLFIPAPILIRANRVVP